MATTGRLSSAQRTALRAGAPVRQQWQIRVPGDTLHLFWQTFDLDDGIFPLVTETDRRVIRAGSRKLFVWNPSPLVTKKPKGVQYSFVVDNSDGIFYESHADNVYQIVGLYQAKAQECEISHRLFVRIPGSHPRATVWSEITHMNFVGVIRSVRFEDTANAAGDPVPGTATITCEQRGAWDALRRLWTVDDATFAAMQDHPFSPTFQHTWTVT